MIGQGDLTRADVQAVSDVRLIALSLKKQWDGDLHRSSNIASLDRIIRECETMIRRGPEEFRFVVEPTVSQALIEAELRNSVFGRGRGRRVEL